MPALLLTAFLVAVPPGDATRLAPDPLPPPAPGAAEADATGDSPEDPEPSEPSGPAVPVEAILAAGAAMMAAVRWREEEPAPGDALGLREDPLVVFVPGHGNLAGDFDDLVGLMDLEPADYEVFDYRWAVETSDPVRAWNHRS